jgi:hypothetical protein
MRSLSAAALAALNLPNPKFFLLADLGFSTPVRATSLPYPVTYNSNLYSPDTAVVSFGPPRVSNTVDREVYELTLIDHNNEYQAYARAGINGKLLTVYAGFLNSAEQPLLGGTDVFIAYKGFMDSAAIVNDGQSKLLVIKAASPMGNLDATGGYIASKDGMDQVSSTDTSFDEIYSGSKPINMKWGKD